MDIKSLLLFFMFYWTCMNCFGKVLESPTKPADNTETPSLKSASITYYVSTRGCDKNPGTSSSPFLTIQKAADIVSPGDTVIVRDGIYTTVKAHAIVTLKKSGASGSYITFKSEHKWGAVLDGQYNAISDGFDFENVSYINLEGFEFKGLRSVAIYVLSGSHNIGLRGNHIHEIGRSCTSQWSYHGTVIYHANSIIFENNLSHDIGRYINGEHGCINTNLDYQSHDHAIYLSGSNDVVIRNNIFYNIKAGWSVHVYDGANVPSSNISIVNNTFSDGNPNRNGSHMALYGTITNIKVKNNIFYNCTNAGIEIIPQYTTVSDVIISNNIACGGTGLIVTNTLAGVTLLNNLKNTDPKMISPETHNFGLQAGSPCINAGVNVGLTTDYLKNPIIGLPDIGAYEFQKKGN